MRRSCRCAARLCPGERGGLGSDLEVTPERAVLMQYVDADDEATQKRFYEALLEIPWLKRVLFLLRTVQCRHNGVPDIAPFACMRALTSSTSHLTVSVRASSILVERPPKGDLYVAAVQEVAERIGMEPEALVQRFRRLKAASTPRPSVRSPRAWGV